MSASVGTVALFSLAACHMSTISDRSQEKAEVFAAASADQQKIMKEGWLNYGFTPDMVYIALGKPDRVATNAEGTMMWTYMNFGFDTPNAALGGTKITATQSKSGNSTGGLDRGPVTNTRNRIDFEVRPDIGSTPPARDLPELRVYFYNGKTNRIQFKRSA